MALSLKNILALGILASSASVFASTHTADFSGVADLNANATSFNYSVDGIDMTISGWSDTYNNLSNSDTEIEAAALDRFGSGWGVDNNDECNGSGGCSPAHSMDNIGSNGWVDYDMILVSFSEAVTLTGADFSWLYRSSETEISVAALSGALASNLDGNTWQSVVNGAMWSDSSHVSNYYAGINAGQTASQYWLVGAYNSIFNTSFSGGTNNNDGMKISSLDFSITTTTDVAEPQTALIMSLGLFAMMLRKRKQIS